MAPALSRLTAISQNHLQVDRRCSYSIQPPNGNGCSCRLDLREKLRYARICQVAQVPSTADSMGRKSERG
jgi:hypothetical protein